MENGVQVLIQFIFSLCVGLTIYSFLEIVLEFQPNIILNNDPSILGLGTVFPWETTQTTLRKAVCCLTKIGCGMNSVS